MLILFGCAAYSSFIEWNSNPEVAAAAEKLYGEIEFLELYVGLQAEEAKPVVDGAGLCPCVSPLDSQLYSHANLSASQHTLSVARS